MTRTLRHTWLVAAAVPLLWACADHSQASARNEATQHTCNWYQHCGQVNPDGGTYPTYDQCQVQQEANWNGAWPVAQCDGKIKLDALNTCLSAIDTTICGNALDFLNTMFNKCNASTVCSGP